VIGEASALWDREAEQYVLSAMLRSRDATAAAMELGLTSGDFHTSIALLVPAIVAGAESDMPLSGITVARQLGDQLEAAGRREYLEDLWRLGAGRDGLGYYAAIVQERALVRREYTLTHDHLMRLQSPDTDAGAEMARFRDALMAADAEQVRADGPRSVGDVLGDGGMERLERWMENPRAIRGIPSGHPQLDLLLGGWQPRRMTVIGAATSAGKTQWMEFIARFAAIGGHPPLLMSTEMSGEDNTDRWVFMEAGMDKLRAEMHGLNESQKHAIRDAAYRLAERRMFVWETGGMDVARIRVVIRRMVQRHGIQIVLLDMLNGINLEMMRGENLAQAMGRHLSALHALAVSDNIHLMVTAHVNRAAMTGGQVLSLNDFRDSAAVEQWADQVITLQPVDATGNVITRAAAAAETSQFGYVRVLANVAKNRFGALGQCLMHLDWDAGGRFTTPSEASA
jgi:replicative DNA helicase